MFQGSVGVFLDGRKCSTVFHQGGNHWSCVTPTKWPYRCFSGVFNRLKITQKMVGG